MNLTVMSLHLRDVQAKAEEENKLEKCRKKKKKKLKNCNKCNYLYFML